MRQGAFLGWFWLVVGVFGAVSLAGWEAAQAETAGPMGGIPLEESSCSLDEFEPDDSLEMAQVLEDGETQIHSFCPGGDADWLVFSVDLTSDITISTAKSGADSGDTEVRLYDSTGELIDQNDDGPGTLYSVLTVYHLSAGEYFVKVDEHEGEPLNAYELLFTIDSTCIPNCSGRECGSDGCDGLCGSCDDELLCSIEGVCCQCLGGPCCDGCYYRATDWVCMDELESEYKCGSDQCGGNAMVRRLGQRCSGDSKLCTGATLWSDWTLLEDCSAGAICDTDWETYASCQACDVGCHFGMCCDSITNEVCNGLDDDCDTLVDEELGSSQCGAGKCTHTIANCIEGVEQICDPFQGATLEQCNGEDDDCDGETDEGLGNTTCGFGVCEHTVTNCTNGSSTTCDPLQGAGPELCNGLDDDCDDQIDEELGEISCGKGECEKTISYCQGGQIQTCDPLEEAATEQCNLKDDDCDGQTDEGLGFTSCGEGVCHHEVYNCEEGVVVTCDPYLGASAEVCNDLDDDCDGATDDDLGETSCGTGECHHTINNCKFGQEQLCNPMGGSAPEVCDGKDNDCDGLTDDNLGELECGLGSCQQTVPRCLDGEIQSCNAMKGATDEVCNLKDDDCDGATDEGLGTTVCGEGECHHEVPLCNNGQPQECDPAEGASEEICNGLDDDCDGETDEELGETSCGKGVCSHTVHNCIDGTPILCDPTEGASEEACNGRDDDCDGQTDDEIECVSECPFGSTAPCWTGDPCFMGGQCNRYGTCTQELAPECREDEHPAEKDIETTNEADNASKIPVVHGPSDEPAGCSHQSGSSPQPPLWLLMLLLLILSKKRAYQNSQSDKV